MHNYTQKETIQKVKMMTQNEWLKEGIEKGYCTETYCDTHDGYAPGDSEILLELSELSEGDHCMSVVRIKKTQLEDQLEFFRREP